MIKVSSSILAFDLSNIESEIKKLEVAKTDFIHIDVMDGKFVKNITMGPCFVKAIKKKTNLNLDVHLMIDDPDRYIKDFALAGADIITIHIEATANPNKALKQIKLHNILAGISSRPDTKIEKIYPYLDLADLALVMTVMPGFAGQKFLDESAKNILKVHNFVKENNFNLNISVDGGINQITKDICIKNGADILVSGSYISKNKYSEAIKLLKN